MKSQKYIPVESTRAYVITVREKTRSLYARGITIEA